MAQPKLTERKSYYNITSQLGAHYRCSLKLTHSFRRRSNALVCRQDHLTIDTGTEENENGNTRQLGHGFTDGLPANPRWLISYVGTIHLPALSPDPTPGTLGFLGREI
jgi:hypothetical protein